MISFSGRIGAAFTQALKSQERRGFPFQVAPITHFVEKPD
jgi:hypothetical protein